jgi:dihydroxyacid dehydratase/phosphogluconate dehydratase
LHLHISDDELVRRKALWKAPEQPFKRGYTKLYQAHVTQAHEGCDFDFLQGVDASPEPVIF